MVRHLHMDAPAPRGGLLQAAVRTQSAYAAAVAKPLV
jgi:hypothetical protein